MAAEAPAAEAAKGPPAWIEALEVAFGSEAEAKGDRKKALDEMRAALERHVASPAAYILLLRMKEISPYDPGPRRAASRYQRLLASQQVLKGAGQGRGELPGLTRELLTDRIARNYRAAGLFGRAEAAEREMGYLRRWAVIGPFGYTTWSVHDREFPPERLSPAWPAGHGGDFERPVKSGHRELRWTMYEAPGSGRRVDLFKPLWPEDGAAYAVAQVRWDEGPPNQERDVLLILRCTGSYKLWWNGGLVANCDRGRGRHTDLHRVRLVVQKGWNLLMLKVGARSPVLSARFADARGRPVTQFEFEDRLVLHEHGPYQRAAQEEVQEEAGQLPRGDELDRYPPATRALLHAALGVQARSLGDHERELEALRRAVELDGQASRYRRHLQYQLALTLRDSPLLPKSTRRTRSQEAYEKAGEGGFVPAELEIAGRLRRDKKAELAIERLKKASAAFPDSAELVLLMARVAHEAGWTHEARTWAHDAEKIDPSSRHIQLFWARFHSRERNYPRAIVAYREVVSLDEWDYASREVLAGLVLARGDTSAGLRELRKAIEADPGRLSGYRSLARAEMEAGRYENATRALLAALRLSPEYPWLHRQLGEVYLKARREEKALAEWERALDVYPGWHELRGQVAALLPQEKRGHEGDFSLPYSTGVEEAIAASKGPGDYPNADVILVVDLTVDRIFEDGSYSEITHQAQKALTTEGVEQLSTIRIEGELLEARTHLPDGTTLEPAVLPGHDSLTMPGVEIGAVVEYKYRRDHPRPAGGFFKLPSWYFRSLETPHQWSHYVVIAPESMKLVVVKRHWSKDYPEETFEEFPARTEAGLRTYRWLATNTRPLHPSASHDHMSTLLPHIEVGRSRSWQDLTGELLDLFLGRTRLTRALVAEAEKAVAKSREGLAGKDAGTPEEKARAIFRHVNELVQADADVYDAHQIMLARAGSRSILLAAMLRAVGLDARFALTRPRPEAISPSVGPGEPEWAFPRRELFRDTLVAVAPSRDAQDIQDGVGEYIWLDAEGRYSPFGAIPSRFQGGVAFVLPPATSPPSSRVRTAVERDNVSARRRRVNHRACPPGGGITENEPKAEGGRQKDEEGRPHPSSLILPPSSPSVASGDAAPAAVSSDGTFTTLPWRPLGEWGETTRSRFEISAETERLRGRKEFVFSGSRGAAYKELFAESSSTWRRTWAEKRLSGALPGSRPVVETEWGIETTGLDDPEAPLTVRADFELAEAIGEAPAWRGQRRGPARLKSPLSPLRDIPTGLAPLEMVSAYVKVPKRTYAMKISSPLVRTDEVEIRLDGVGSWRPPPSHTAKSSFGSYSLTFTWEGPRLLIRRRVTLLPQVIEPEEYEEFVRFCREIDAAEHAPLRVRLLRDRLKRARVP